MISGRVSCDKQCNRTVLQPAHLPDHVRVSVDRLPYIAKHSLHMENVRNHFKSDMFQKLINSASTKKGQKLINFQ